MLANDHDIDSNVEGPLAIVSCTTPQFGSVTCAGTVTFVAGADSDAFTDTVEDSSGQKATATVTILPVPEAG